MLRSFTASDGRRLSFADSGGDGPAALCLAGLSRNHRDFDDITARLAPSYRVIRLDSRGRGASEHATDPHAEYTVPIEVGDALALIDHLGPERLALIGTSRGGILSMAIAGARPDCVSAVVLNDVGAIVEGRGLRRISETLGTPPAASSFEAAAAALKEANIAAFPGVPDAEWLRHARRLYDDHQGRPALAYDPRLGDVVADALQDGDAPIALWPLFHALKTVPTLVLRGENSDILLAETVEAMRAEHPDMGAVTVRNRGHAPFLNEPEAVDAILSFLGAHAR